MNINVSQARGRVPVAILSVEGDLDASNYQDLITQAQQVCAAGTGHILLDLTHTSFVSSSGLVAMHSIAMLLRGEELPDLEHGWAAIHAVGQRMPPGIQPRLKLLNPQPRVSRTLDKAGLGEFFEIHTDLSAAVASF